METTAQCAERDRMLITVIEDRGNANDVASERLAAAAFSVLDARNICRSGREVEAVALYDRALEGLSNRQAQR